MNKIRTKPPATLFSGAGIAVQYIFRCFTRLPPTNQIRTTQRRVSFAFVELIHKRVQLEIRLRYKKTF